MLLYILRHAWAEAVEDWPDDFQRPLTAEGQQRFTRMLQQLVGGGFAPQIVATSPLVRCRQTADLIAQVVAGHPPVVPREELLPGSDLQAILAWTERRARDCPQVAWVGHAPDVGQLAAALIGPARGQIRFAKGAVAAIDFDGLPKPGAGELRWLVTAKLLGV